MSLHNIDHDNKTQLMEDELQKVRKGLKDLNACVDGVLCSINSGHGHAGSSGTGWASTRADALDSNNSAEAENAASMEKFDLYVKLGEDCVEALQKMPLPKFNNEQCGYLVEKLQVIVQRTSLFLEVIRAEHHRCRSFVDLAKQVDMIFKLLLALAKEIESFVQGCCKDSWIQAAMTLTNVWEHVALVGFNLELCRVVFCMECAANGGLTRDEVEEIHEAEIEVVKKKAFADVDTLFQKVILEMPSLSSEDNDLAFYLIQRLKQVKPISASELNLSGSSSGNGSGYDGGCFGRLFKWVKPGGQLGRGASGTVDKAMWLGTPVAKKTFYGTENPDFMKEVEVLSPLCHPNVMSVFCSAKNLRSCSIIMELMDEDLHTLMQRRLEENNPPSLDDYCPTPFPILEAVDIMLQIGEGMRYLHNQRIVHRDLKSMNILVKNLRGKDSDGYVHAKVADFGLSKTKEKSIRHSSMTYNVGSSRWMPPEIIKLDTSDLGNSSTSSEGPKHPLKCDVYNFGMLCFEILTGDIPFSTIYNLKEVKMEVMEGERPKLPKDPKYCPFMLKDLIERCWSSIPEERPTFTTICSILKYLKYLLMKSCEMTQESIQLRLHQGSNCDSMELLSNKYLNMIPHKDENLKVIGEISKISIPLPLLDQITGGRTSIGVAKDIIGTVEEGNSQLPTTSKLDAIDKDGDSSGNSGAKFQEIAKGLNDLSGSTRGQELTKNSHQGLNLQSFGKHSGLSFVKLHRGTALRMLTCYLTDLTTLNVSLDDNLKKLVDEYQTFSKELAEANLREPNSPLTWRERSKLNEVLKDYQTALFSAPIEDQDDDEEEDVPGVDDMEFKVEREYAPHGKLPYFCEVKFSVGGNVESLTSALDLCEMQVREFKKLLPLGRVLHQQRKNLVETLAFRTENLFELCHKVLVALEMDEGDSHHTSVNFCFESLVGLAHEFQMVGELLRKCASENLQKTALVLADLPPPPLMSRRWSEFSLAIRACEWSMDLVEFAFHTLEKILAGVMHIFQDVSFKWSEEMCRMVLQVGRQGNVKSVLEVSKELEAKDLNELIDQLRRVSDSVASFLREKLSGPIPHSRYLSWTFRVDLATLKFRDYLDSGGAGMVAEYSWFGERVAVKSVRSPSLTRHKFEKEVAILATVQHPNVVRLIGCGFIDKKNTGMLVMELMDSDLRTVIDSRVQEQHLGPGSSPFTVMVAIDIIMQIVQAMRYLKDHKVLHMDLQAKNILVNMISRPLNPTLLWHVDHHVSTGLPALTQERYVVKLADFGLARCRSHSSWARSRLDSKTGWRAPEVFYVLDTEVTHEYYKWPADVYSFAMTCYEILTGNSPFANLPSESIYENVMAGKRPEGLDELDIPELLKDLVRKCWVTNPQKRPTFDEIERSLWECKLKAVLPGFERQICRERSASKIFDHHVRSSSVSRASSSSS